MPGTPDDPILADSLPSPDVLWRNAALTLLFEALDHAATDEWMRDYWLTGDGSLGFDDHSEWWGLDLLPAGRALLYGFDHEESHTHDHNMGDPDRAIDLTGGPGWLPAENLERIRGLDELGYVYWYDDGAWHHVPYPDDLDGDGSRLTVGEVADTDEVVRGLLNSLHGRLGTAQGPARDETGSALRALLEAATRRELIRSRYDDLMGRLPLGEADLDGGFEVARRAGFVPGGD